MYIVLHYSNYSLLAVDVCVCVCVCVYLTDPGNAMSITYAVVTKLIYVI